MYQDIDLTSLHKLNQMDYRLKYKIQNHRTPKDSLWKNPIVLGFQSDVLDMILKKDFHEGKSL